jgi:hypothetical protein
VNELIITDASDQEFTTIVAGRRCTFRVRFNVTTQRWSFDLKIGDTQMLVGRRIVLGVDLLAPFDFAIGSILAIDYEGNGNLPDRVGLPQRRVRLYHATEDEMVGVA